MGQNTTEINSETDPPLKTTPTRLDNWTRKPSEWPESLFITVWTSQQLVAPPLAGWYNCTPANPSYSILVNGREAASLHHLIPQASHQASYGDAHQFPGHEKPSRNPPPCHKVTLWTPWLQTMIYGVHPKASQTCWIHFLPHKTRGIGSKPPQCTITCSAPDNRHTQLHNGYSSEHGEWVTDGCSFTVFI